MIGLILNGIFLGQAGAVRFMRSTGVGQGGACRRTESPAAGAGVYFSSLLFRPSSPFFRKAVTALTAASSFSFSGGVLPVSPR
ncbi:hypothetical protein Metal_2468 [Methylomicrobium album BG8]|uniref:Uncharacterized protein n=1 Tax=Methylomicrobium album BG8 TaxID=686340 RepID=H8GI43_METAL|nr:hypothetical protein Metal_2468 [Methylomicrobium album BG8]